MVKRSYPKKVFAVRYVPFKRKYPPFRAEAIYEILSLVEGREREREKWRAKFVGIIWLGRISPTEPKTMTPNFYFELNTVIMRK